jgi:methionine biosynthesis protein MetW
MNVVIKELFYREKISKEVKLANRRLRSVLALFKNRHFSRLLDIGCGSGSFTTLLKKYCDEIYGLDIVTDAIEQAKSKGIKASKIDIDTEVLPFENNFFDAIYCGEIIEHIYDTDNFLNQINRILINDGMCIITTPNFSWWLNRVVLLMGFQPYLSEVSLKYNVGKFCANINEVSGHIRLFTFRALKEILKLHNFDVIQTVYSDVSNVLPFPANIAEKCLSIIPSFRHSNIFVIRKRIIK